MDSNEENEKRKFAQFKREIKNEREITGKIQNMFNNEFDDSFQDILISTEEEFLTNISDNINSLLTDMYSEECLSDDNLIKICEIYDKDVEDKYKNSFELLNKSLKIFERENRRGKINEKNYLTNFVKHCAETDDIPYHNCQNSLSRFYQIEENGEIKYVICENCHKVYLNNMILCHCQNCNEDYYSSTLGKNEDGNLLPATWKKYHCEKVINEKMKCVKCHSILYLNLKKKILVCLNSKCNFSSKPESMLWICNVCKSEFRSDAIVFNPRDNENLKKIITQTLFIKRKAHPNKMPCCKLNIFFTNFYHKNDCRGNLYFGELNNNIIVVCEKCKAFNFYDRFIWTCPKCGTKFRDKKENSQEEKRKSDEFDRKNLEAYTSPIRKRNDDNNTKGQSKTNYNYENENQKNKFKVIRRLNSDHHNELNKYISDDIDREKKYLEEREKRKKEREEKLEKERKEKEEKEKREKEKEERRERREKERKEKEEKENNKLIFYEKVNIKNKNSLIKNGNENIEKKKKKKKKNSLSNLKNASSNLKNYEKQIEKILNESKLPKFDIKDYTLYKQIGEGSYGVIYQAYNNNDRKKYAMKKIIAHDIDELEGFEEEFELVYICDHPNVMKIFGICVNILDSTTFALYVLMELALGDWNDEIKKHLSVRKHYKEDDLINILKQIVSSLLFMQEKMKIAHRDIKPQNILIFKNKIYKVADFGEAKEAKIAKQLNTLRGTELYMSPVLYDGLKKDKDDVRHNPYKSDVFSLGFCLMYAASLNFNMIYEVRDVTDMSRMEKIINKHLKNKYTQKFIKILILMLEIDENKRCDFVQLNDYINEQFPNKK